MIVGRPTGRLTWDVNVAARAVADAAAEVSALECDRALLEAVLADHYRDMHIQPVRPDLFSQVTHSLDEGSWLRFAVVVGMLAHEELRGVIPALSQRMPVREQIEKGMVKPSKDLQAVDLRLLTASLVRAEELARRVAKELGIEFQGETFQESVSRLNKIDYSRLLQNVEAARAAAEQQSDERLKARQRRVLPSRRGKF
jgi:hypothetical protein